MLVIVGLIVLFVAVIVGVVGVLGNAGAAHPLTENFSVLGYHVTGSTGTLKSSQREAAFLNQDRDRLLEHRQHTGAATGSPAHQELATTRRPRTPLLGRFSRGRQSSRQSMSADHVDTIG
ncbi:MAG TPA: hypothetical protein VKG81_03965 [Mycobacterium sp.]|nr:hypothetical protein [Mycobacterium sp.]HME47274.1 hypothetical protein [Mycobacterium sp.]